MEAAIRRSALGGDLSAPKTPTTPTLANRHERPPDARTGAKNKQPRANMQVQKLQTLTRFLGLYALVCHQPDEGRVARVVFIISCPIESGLGLELRGWVQVSLLLLQVPLSCQRMLDVPSSLPCYLGA